MRMVSDIFYGTIRWPDELTVLPLRLLRTLRSGGSDAGLNNICKDPKFYWDEELSEQLRLFDFFLQPFTDEIKG